MYKASVVVLAYLAVVLFSETSANQHGLDWLQSHFVRPEVTYSCSGKHEHHACLPRQITCGNLNKPAPEKPQCIHGCYCEEGYARDDNGLCVLTKDCPKNPKEAPVLDEPIAIQYKKTPQGRFHIYF